MKKISYLLPLAAILVVPGCGQSNTGSESNSFSDSKSSSLSKTSITSFSSKTSNPSSSGIDLSNLTLTNDDGLKVDFSTKGARIEKITYDGKSIAQNGFIAGRVANRIKNGSFSLNGKTYTLNKNDGNNTLHGGSRGFGEVTWEVEERLENSITFKLNSKDGDMGFPGNMVVRTKYTLSEDSELSFEISATSDADTIFNPINHLYMNLNGNTSVSNHSLWIDADSYLENDYSKLPTGKVLDVSSKSSLDYRNEKTYISGNDNCLILNDSGYRKVAELTGETTGYKMELYTDRVALQLYDDRQRICLEAQDYVDAIHHENFPSIVLKANTEWYSKSSYCFSKTK